MKTTRGEIFYEIKNRDFFVIKSVCKRYFNITDVISILKHKKKDVYKVVLHNDVAIKVKVYDINDSEKVNQIEYNSMLYKKINIPRDIGVVTTPKNIFRACEWINGAFIDFNWNKKNMLKFIGRTVGIINRFKDKKSDKFLIFDKLNESHIIWSNDGNIYFIGDNFKPVTDVYKEVARLIYTNLKDAEKIKLFLLGYKKEDETDEIQKWLNTFYNLEQNNEKKEV